MGWLRFVIIAELLPAKRIEAVLDECDQLCRILGKSVATAKGMPLPKLRYFGVAAYELIQI